MALATACSGVGAATPTSTPTPTVDTTPRLGPPPLTLHAAGGAQVGIVGSYDWVTDKGFGAKVQAHGYQFPTPPLTIKVGESVSFVVQQGSGAQPTSLTLQAYPQQGNVKPLASRDGTINAFVLPSTPAAGQGTPSGNPQAWKVDLQPGQYFLLVKGDWPSPIKAHNGPLYSEFVYSVTVGQ